jgi:putative addiction module component (TIGR02574 family)
LIELSQEATMIISKDELYREAVKLSPLDKAQLVELILSSFNYKGRDEIDSKWAKEVEDRLQASKDGLMNKISMEEVFTSLNI